MDAYTMSASSLTILANQQKELFLEMMLKEEQITQDQLDNMNDYCFVITEKSYFGRIWNKIFFKDNDDMKISVVKIIV